MNSDCSTRTLPAQRTEAIGFFFKNYSCFFNNANQVVGRFNLAPQELRRSFFHWDKDNHFHDLKKLLDPDDPMTAKVVLSGEAQFLESILVPKLHDRGEILATGSLRGENIQDGPRHTFLLVPVRKRQD